MANTQIKIYGIIKAVFPVETIGNFKKKVIWVEETEVNYPQTFSIEFANNRIEELNLFKGGETVEVVADVRGRYVSKAGKEYVFNSLSGYKIQNLNSFQKPEPSTRQQTGGIPPAGTPPVDEDDLPF